MGKSGPKAPDPYETAQAEASINRLNQITPTGNIQFGNYDPQTGDWVPTANRESVMVTLSPEQEAIRQAGMGLSASTLQNLRGMDQPRTAREIRQILPSFQGLTQGTPELRSSQAIESTLTPAGDMGRLGQGLNDINLSGLQRDFSADSTRAEQATYQQAMGRLDPQFQRQRDQVQAQLQARGIPVDSDAYRAEMNRVDQSQGQLMNDLLQSSILAGRQEQGRLFGQEMSRLGAEQGVRGQRFGENVTGINLAEALRGARLGEGLSLAGLEGAQRGQLFGENVTQAQAALQKQLALANLESQQRTQQINELLGLQTGQQVQAPQAVNVPGINYSGLVANQYAADAQQAASKNQALGTMAGMAAQAAMMSDARVKDRIEYLGTKSGHKVYEFSYKGDDARYRGVMAQDLLETQPDAVVNIDGILHVNYDKIAVQFERVS